MRSNLLRFCLKVTISAILIWLIVQRLDLSDLAARAKAVSLSGALLVVFLLLMQCVVASVRWEWVIRVMGHHFPLRYALRAWLIGHFLGQGFPSTIGHDAFRVMSLRRYGIPTPVAFEIILLDRFTGVVALILLAGIALPLLFKMATNTAPLFPLALVIAGAMLATILLFSRFPISKWFPPFPGLALASRLRSNLKRLIETHHHMLWMLVPALAAHLLTVAAAYVIARDGATQIGLLECLAIIPPAILVSLIPLSIAGWGIREGSVVAGALLLGLPSADGLFVSVMLGLGFLVVGLIGGIVWLVGGGDFPAVTEGGRDDAQPHRSSQDG